MKKAILSLGVVAMFVVLSLGFVSASLPICSTIETTYVGGTITDQNSGNPISGASVDVTCNGHLKSTISDSIGGYSVEYLASECDNGDNVSVSASHDGLNGNNENVSWYTQDTQIGCLRMIVNVGCANVPLIPEFGAMVGALTVLSAIGVFFFVRRK
jgi:hypothetical protein